MSDYRCPHFPDNDYCECELTNLRARLAAVEAALDAQRQINAKLIEGGIEQASLLTAAEARLAEVLARCREAEANDFVNFSTETVRAAAAGDRAEVEADRDDWKAAWAAERRDGLAAEARLAAVRRALDDEIANLADDGARLSHAVVRRIESILAGGAAGAETDPVDTPPHNGRAAGARGACCPLMPAFGMHARSCVHADNRRRGAAGEGETQTP